MMKGLRQSNKGFTLVELCVVMVIFSVVVSISTFSLIQWQHDYESGKQDSNAELIYMAIKNKIAIYKANDATEELPGFYDPNNVQEDDIGLDDDDPVTMASFKGFDYLSCKKGDYEKYADPATRSQVDQHAKMLFKYVEDYIKDKTVLNASITIEFDSDRNIIAVFYSDRWGYFSYTKTSKQDPNCIRITNLKTKPETRYEKLVGLYMP